MVEVVIEVVVEVVVKSVFGEVVDVEAAEDVGAEIAVLLAIEDDVETFSEVEITGLVEVCFSALLDIVVVSSDFDWPVVVMLVICAVVVVSINRDDVVELISLIGSVVGARSTSGTVTEITMTLMRKNT